MERVFRAAGQMGACECAANLCDLLSPDISTWGSEGARAEIGRIISAVEAQAGRGVSRLYVGSYFCDRYFCALGLPGIACAADFARGNGLALTLVVPIFGQQTLAQGEKAIADALAEFSGEDGPLDEVCVNDFGEASFLRGLLGNEGLAGPRPRLSWGRLFARALRDPRYGSFSAEAQDAPYDMARARDLAERFGVSLLELDPFAPRVSLRGLQGTLPVALHLPHSYQTTGHICEFASLARPVSRKFRPDCACDCACLKTLSVYETRSDEGRPVFFSKQGRTVYFENSGCEVDDLEAIERIIWTPDDFGCPHELGPSWAQWAAGWTGGDAQWA